MFFGKISFCYKGINIRKKRADRKKKRSRNISQITPKKRFFLEDSTRYETLPGGNKKKKT